MGKAIISNNTRQPIVAHGGNLNAGHVPTSPARAVIVINQRQPVQTGVPTTSKRK